MRILVSSIHALSKIFGVFSALLIASAILVVCQMVAIRYLFNGSTVWQTEYVTYAIVAATFLGSPYVLLVKGHVNVDLLPHYLPPTGRKILAVIASLLALVFCSVLCWQSILFFWEALDGGWVTDTVWELPLWIPYLPMVVGIFLLCLQFIADLFTQTFADPDTVEDVFKLKGADR